VNFLTKQEKKIKWKILTGILRLFPAVLDPSVCGRRQTEMYNRSKALYYFFFFLTFAFGLVDR
jgi:hypothetical protein